MGGRQRRLADAYLDTAVEREIKEVLARGVERLGNRGYRAALISGGSCVRDSVFVFGVGMSSRLQPGSLRSPRSVLTVCQYSPQRTVGSSSSCMTTPVMPGVLTRTSAPTANRCSALGLLFGRGITKIYVTGTEASISPTGVPGPSFCYGGTGRFELRTPDNGGAACYGSL